MREIRAHEFNHGYNLGLMEEVRTNTILHYSQTCIKPSPMGGPIQGECLKLYSATEDWFDCSSWIDWLDQNKTKNENIPDMREGGRGIGFDRNVGWKGGGGGI